MASQTTADREAIFLANTMTREQATTEASALRERVRARQVACADCGESYTAKELDISTGLCLVCHEVAGLENDLQDERLTEEQFIRDAIALSYKGTAITDAEREEFSR